MSVGKFLEVGDDVLEKVVLSLEYSSLEEFQSDVNTVKEWMKNQPHFPEILDDKKVRNFLILNKGRVEETKQKIDNYYSVRSNLTEIYGEINPKFKYMQKVLDAFYFVLLPRLTKEHYRVFFYKTRTKSLLSFFNPVYGVRYLVNVQEIRLLEDVIHGDIFVFDGKDIPFSAFFYLTPSIIRNALVTIYKNVFSNRVKAVYILNAPFFIDKLVFLFKAVLKPKLFKRIHFLKSVDALFENLDGETIPRDYGGDAAYLEDIQKATRLKFQEYRAYFDKLDKLRVREELRP